MIRSRTALALGLAAVLVTACSTDPAPTPSPTQTGLPTPTASGQPAPTASSTPANPTPTTPGPSPTEPPAAGLAWTSIGLPFDDSFAVIGVVDVAVLDGVFLAAGVGWQEDEQGVQVNVPLFWRSADGRAWQLLEDTWPGGYVDVLTTWQGQFLAAGYVGDERASAAFWTSADGQAWQRLPDAPVLEFFRGATEGRDIVAGGISHARSETDTVIALGWLYCACASEIRDAAVEWRTTDGREWQRSELAAGEDVAPPVATAGGSLLRIAPSGTAIEVSPDGSNWQPAWPAGAGGPAAEPAVQLFALAAWPGGLLAVGADLEGGVGRPLALSSVDGLSWARSTGTGIDDVDGALVDFAASSTAIVAVGRIGDPAAPHVWLHLP